MDNGLESITDITQTKCSSCGGIMEFAPESQNLKCIYCGATMQLEIEPIDVEENDLDYWFDKSDEQIDTHSVETNNIKCRQCGAVTSILSNKASAECAFCGTPLILNEAEIKRFWQPEYILPFTISKKVCGEHFFNWLKKRWFLPSELKKNGPAYDSFKGVYLPFWTFDADSKAIYVGQRGINRTEVSRNSKGEEIRRTVTDWSYASGVVEVSFDDVIIPGTNSLPSHIIKKLTNWDKDSYVPFKKEFLAGFVTDVYSKDFRAGWTDAKEKMKVVIDSSIRNDIGGDKQKIDSSDITFSNKKFKLVLLPIWMSAFQFGEKKYQFVINGRTGEVFGEYPKSTGKIIMLIILIIAIILILMMIF